MTVRIALLALLLLAVAPGALAASDLRISKGVDDSFPASGNPVSFEIVVTNNGPDPTRTIEVTDRLPAGLVVPDALGIFLSQGDFNVASGAWTVGELLPEESATLTIPAVPEQFSMPACYVNRAEISAASTADPDTENNVASAGVYVGGLQSCAHVNLSVVPEILLEPDCKDRLAAERLVFNIEVSNFGPDEAESVRVTLTGTHPKLADAAPDDLLDLGDIPAGSVASGTLSWWFRCGQSPENANYVIQADTTTHATDDSTLRSSGTFRVPDTGSCDCSVWYGGGAGSGCFIATAAYGSDLHPHLRSLRYFRDEFLLTNWLGRKMVDFYYRKSPPIADAISKHASLRWLARVLLGVLVFGIEHPWAALVLVGGTFAVWYARPWKFLLRNSVAK